MCPNRVRGSGDAPDKSKNVYSCYLFHTALHVWKEKEKSAALVFVFFIETLQGQSRIIKYVVTRVHVVHVVVITGIAASGNMSHA